MAGTVVRFITECERRKVIQGKEAYGTQVILYNSPQDVQARCRRCPYNFQNPNGTCVMSANQLVPITIADLEGGGQ